MYGIYHGDFIRHTKTQVIFSIQRQNYLISWAKNCCSYYTLHEMEGGLAIDRNHCVITLTFYESNDCIEFIKLIKPIKKLYIECIYTNTPRFKIIYVSSYYFAKKMSKDGKQVYKKTTCSKEEQVIKNIIIFSQKSISK